MAVGAPADLMFVGQRQADAPSLVTRALAGLANGGKVGVELGWRLDLLRSTRGASGLRHVAGAPRGLDLERNWNAFHRRIWQHAAECAGAELEDLSYGFLELRRGDRKTLVWQYQVMVDDPVTLRLALDKAISYRLFAAAGLSVPSHVEFTADDLAPAFEFLARTDRPCVVKPASGTAGGRGVTCGVVSADDLVRACIRSIRWDRRLLIEQLLDGEEYRLLFLDGELLDVIRRRPPVLIADGRSTVDRLIRSENERRQASRGEAGLRRIEVDLDCVLALRASGLSLRSVPPAGTAVRVKSTANANGPGDNEAIGQIDAHLVEEASRAAALVGVRLAGVEVITPDLHQPLQEAGGAIVEVNGTPGLHYHYLVSPRERATPVADLILAKLLGVSGDLTSSP